MNWIRIKVCFALQKSSLLCLRDPRTVCRKEKYQSSNVTLMFHTNMPKFELQNSHILARSGGTSMSLLNNY